MDNKDNIMYLKQKCNAQLDKIQELEKTIEKTRQESVKKEKKIEELLAKIKEGRKGKELVDNGSQTKCISEDFIECAQVLNYILKEVPDMKIFIKYKNRCQNALDFYKISKPELEKVVGDLISKNNYNKFFDFCAAIGVMRSDRGKYVFSDPNNRFYMFRKQAFKFVEEET